MTPLPLRVGLLLGGMFLITFPLLSTAHRLREALTTIEVNEHTGLVEIIHRFSLHDVEHLLDSRPDLIDDARHEPSFRQTFGDYVVRHFALADENLEPIELTLLGTEIEGPYFWVYQEMAASLFDKIAFVTYGTMQEAWIKQPCQVNVKRPSGVTSVYLKAGDTFVAVPPPKLATVF